MLFCPDTAFIAVIGILMGIRLGTWSAACISTLRKTCKDEAAPFAFLATYTTRLSAHAKAQHLPLGHALREYAGAANRERLLSLLLPAQRAAESCPWLKAMVDAGEIFHPLRWMLAQAMQLLRDVPQLESAGVVVRMPATWRANRPPRPQVTATVDGKPPHAEHSARLMRSFIVNVTMGFNSGCMLRSFATRLKDGACYWSGAVSFSATTSTTSAGVIPASSIFIRSSISSPASSANEANFATACHSNGLFFMPRSPPAFVGDLGKIANSAAPCKWGGCRCIASSKPLQNSCF
jgi:SNF2 Helicase protein